MPEINGSNNHLNRSNLNDSQQPLLPEESGSASDISGKSRHGQSVQQVRPQSFLSRIKTFFGGVFNPSSINGRRAKVVHQAKDVIPEMIPGKVKQQGLKDIDEGGKLGEGSFGEVYRAKAKKPGVAHKRPHALQKNYVVKDQKVGFEINGVIRERRGGAKQAKKEAQFQREAKGAVPVVDETVEMVGQDLHHKVMMEHGGLELGEITGLTDKKILEQKELNPYRLAKGKALDEGTSRVIATELFEQLADLHEQGVAHRDIKSANILINHQGKARLSDFGIAQKARDNTLSGGSNALKYHGVAGTTAYMAPEVLLNDVYSEKVDCWSMGMVLLELLTGEESHYIYTRDKDGDYQFEFTDYLQLVEDVTLHPHLSRQAKETILSLIDVDPEVRPTAREVLNQDFFQVPDQPAAKGKHFQLQVQHQKKFQALAEKERSLEALEASAKPKKRWFRNPRVVESRTEEIDSLKREVRVSGLEVKSLQAQMELEDIYAELSRLENRMPAVLDEMGEDYRETVADSVDARIAVAERDVLLKRKEIEHIDSTVALMQQKNRVMAQLAEHEQPGSPESDIESLRKQAGDIDIQLQSNDLNYQIDCLELEMYHLDNYPGEKNEKQQARLEELPLLIKEKMNELDRLSS